MNGYRRCSVTGRSRRGQVRSYGWCRLVSNRMWRSLPGGRGRSPGRHAFGGATRTGR
ncbi:hypothetical protein X12_000227 [Xanthomonas arboricola]|nr:hypothetical protein X12_000227 [Xanthomonas arboricola]